MKLVHLTMKNRKLGAQIVHILYRDSAKGGINRARFDAESVEIVSYSSYCGLQIILVDVSGLKKYWLKSGCSSGKDDNQEGYSCLVSCVITLSGEAAKLIFYYARQKLLL
mmetsp:Transcript_13871/g.23671  ORF Transcript_13871/g.23671 Transcript_13871/m.23671 type:complete len:110 (+) Transcript_13871:1000-1329(+)